MKGLVYLLCGLAGGIAGAAAFDALRGDTPARAAPETRTVVDTTRDEAVARLERRVDELATLVATLRGASPAPGGTDTAAGATDGAPERLPGAADPGAGTAADADVDAVVRGLAGRRFGYSEFGRLFNWSLNNKDKIRTLIAALEREIEADPTNADLRVALASAWVGELTNNTPAGPQQGMVWVKAEAAYNKALELDPNHWQGRFGKAFGTSMVPEFLGMRPAANNQL